MNFNIFPTGIAVHTRGVEHGYDYGWYVKIGDIQLFSIIEELHRIALRDKESEEVPLFLVLLEPQKQRGGIVFSQIPSPRRDHGQRVIYDTLYLEFQSEEQKNILKIIAKLLICKGQPYKKYQRYFSKYTEVLYRLGQEFIHPLCLRNDLIKTELVVKESLVYINAVVKSEEKSKLLYQKYQELLKKVTICPIGGDDLEKELLEINTASFEPDKLALPNNEHFRKQCASYLANYVDRGKSLCVISTGLVNLEKCYQIAEKVDNCIVLTESSEIQEETKLKKEFSIKKMISTMRQGVTDFLKM